MCVVVEVVEVGEGGMGEEGEIVVVVVVVKIGVKVGVDGEFEFVGGEECGVIEWVFGCDVDEVGVLCVLEVDEFFVGWEVEVEEGVVGNWD